VGNTLRLRQSALRHVVHPHVRGEYSAMSCSNLCFNGSSPRAWGILYIKQSADKPVWFIPTCVGNTQIIGRCFGGQLGSSPRAWGIPKTWTDELTNKGFIPTCVGNTNIFFFFFGSFFGSSPRAWGIPPMSPGSYSSSGFIPTCVGNTRCCQ